jgi:hypothetical protein
MTKWAIKKTKEEFFEWLKRLGTHSLFFDEASRNNPRVVAVGGSCLGGGSLFDRSSLMEETSKPFILGDWDQLPTT